MHRLLSFWSAFFLFFLILSFGTSISFAQWVPMEYYPNYMIQEDYAKVQEAFVTIEAAQKISDFSSLDSTIFSQIHASFKKLFPAFPQEYTFKVSYQQCLNLSKDLISSKDMVKLQSFMNNCYKPLNQIISKINSDYTVKVNVLRNPHAWSAPLTVTFDARGSLDPSQETIPSKNFFWYYRDTKGVDRVIWNGNVINYTFEEAGNYQVHLTVRSSNISQGYLDGEATFNVNVSPKAAHIVVYANQKKLDRNKAIKIWTQEAKKWVILDGSATMAMDGRKIESHQRNISNSDGFKFSKAGDGSPRYITVPFNWNGEYKVMLSTKDNENNTVYETFSIIVSDPVAVIKQSPSVGTTSTQFSFDSNASYSLVSRLKLYIWEIFNAKGDKIDTIQGKTLKKQFSQIGNYLVKLTVEDQLGQSNVDVVDVYVSSTKPVPQFSVTSTNKRTDSSEFYLDANATTDLDVTNGHDSLEYKREFSNPAATKIIATDNNNQQITIQFDEVGTHTIKLTVTDMYGESASIEKQIIVKSILRPELTIVPAAVTWWRNVSFKVQTNIPVVGYRWNFGDGEIFANQNNTLQHIYKKVGIYTVSVQVMDQDGNMNTITEKIFIGQFDRPISAFRVKNAKGFYLQTTTQCSYQSGDEVVNVPAYSIDRYQDVTIDPSLSVNAQGSNTNLVFNFRLKQGLNDERSFFVAKFNEVGCHFVDLTVEDTSSNKRSFDTSRIWFKVNNALPTLKNLVLSFPQYGNESWIWFQVNSAKNVLDINSDAGSTLMVKLSAVNAVDPDGNISYFKRYYYPKDNPAQVIETKITPGNIPYVFFTLPKIAGEYMFWVAMYDHDNAYQKSEYIIGNWPTVFFPQTDNNPNIPIVTLKLDKHIVEVWDTVTFDVISKVTSDSDDFNRHRTIQYDFDGDGERDLVTTKDRVEYVYTTPNEEGFTPRAAVIYRGFKGISENRGNILTVKNGVKPMLLFNTIKNIAVVRDLSMGNLIYRQICFDEKLCAAGDRQYLKTDFLPPSANLSHLANPILQRSVFLQKYPTYDPRTITLDIKSNLWVNVGKTFNLQLSNNTRNWRITTGLNLITIPETSFNNKDPEIYVSEAMKNKVLFYLYHEGSGTCFIDTNLALDTNNDGVKENDVDILCNKLVLWDYVPQFDSIVARMYFPHKWKLMFKNFSVNFESFEENILDENMQIIYNNISTLYNGIEDTNNANADLRVLLDTLRKNLLDSHQTSANLVMLQTHLNGNATILLDEHQKSLLDSIIASLSTAETIAVMGGNEYEQAKNEILAGLPAHLKTEVLALFTAFDAESDTLDDEQKKQKLTDILNYIAQHAETNGISRTDLDNFFLAQFCKILQYYNLQSQQCALLNWDPSLPDLPSVDSEASSESSSLPLWLKIILWIIFWGIAIMGSVVVFFAIRAKMKASAEEDDEE